MAGILYENDLETLINSLKLCASRFTEMFLVEIGCHEGKTSKSLIEILRTLNNNFKYYGIDPIDPNPKLRQISNPTIKYKEFIFIKGYSFEEQAVSLVPPNIHWLFIDGCHCAECVARDTKLYATRLVPGGVVCYHDCSSKMQGKYSQDYPQLREHHDAEKAKIGVNVLSALENLLDMSEFDLHLLRESENQKMGGVRVYHKGNIYRTRFL